MQIIISKKEYKRLKKAQKKLLKMQRMEELKQGKLQVLVKPEIMRELRQQYDIRKELEARIPPPFQYDRPTKITGGQHDQH